MEVLNDHALRGGWGGGQTGDLSQLYFISYFLTDIRISIIRDSINFLYLAADLSSDSDLFCATPLGYFLKQLFFDDFNFICKKTSSLVAEVKGMKSKQNPCIRNLLQK